MPTETPLNDALPFASFCVVSPPSSVKVNCATGFSSLPFGSKVSFSIEMQPFAGGGVVTITFAVQ